MSVGISAGRFLRGKRIAAVRIGFMLVLVLMMERERQKCLPLCYVQKVPTALGQIRILSLIYGLELVQALET